MEGPTTGFWAKLTRDGSGRVAAWHPLEAHCADVAAVTEALLNGAILGRRFGRLIGSAALCPEQMARLCVLAALHDAGKTNHGFQQRAFPTGQTMGGHVQPLVDFLNWDEEEKAQIVEALGLAEMLAWFASEEDFIGYLLAAFAHHGRPVTPGTGFSPRLWRAAHGRDPVEGMRGLRQAAAQWFPQAFASNGATFPHSPELQHAFNGLLMLADWIASDDALFPYAQDGTDRMAFARRWAPQALLRLGLAPRAARRSLGARRPQFGAVSEFSPRPVQRVCTELTDHAGGSLTILESDTGSGKTEAALARFVRLFHAGLVDGLYFALPTRAAATQLHGRVVQAMRQAFPDKDSRPAVVLAVPGYLTVDEAQGRKLAPFEVLWPDDDAERWRYRGWAAESPKRYLSGTVAVGTVDQVLLSALQVNHAHLRATALLRHLLVVDEVHASDTYMGRLMEEVLEHHLRAGGHALLMSATLGSAARVRFLGKASEPPLEEAVQAPYPLLTHADGGREVVELLEAEPTGYSKEVEVEARPHAARPEEVAHRALEAARRGARVLIVRNTVRGCVATQRQLERQAPAEWGGLFRVDGVPAPHHSRFAGADRKRLDRAVESVFGKGVRGKGVVLAATQTVEQSLDLDADLLISDLCPADVLLQRIGRLHRHPKERPPAARPEGFRQARTVVLVPQQRELSMHIRPDGCACGPHGLGTVYEDMRVLEATWRLLEEHHAWRIPEMNRRLVESATHPEALSAIVAELGGRWREHEEYILGVRSADYVHAGLVLLPRRKPFGAVEFPSDPGRRVRTRLGQDDRRIPLEPPVRGPFGRMVGELTLPAYWAPDVPDDATAENVRSECGTVSFDFGGNTFIYDRLGLRPADPQHKEE